MSYCDAFRPCSRVSSGEKNNVYLNMQWYKTATKNLEIKISTKRHHKICIDKADVFIDAIFISKFGNCSFISLLVWNFKGHFFVRQRMRCNAISQIFLNFTYVIQNLILSSTKKKKIIKIGFVVFELSSNKNFEFYAVAHEWFCCFFYFLYLWW